MKRRSIVILAVLAVVALAGLITFSVTSRFKGSQAPRPENGAPSRPAGGQADGQAGRPSGEAAGGQGGRQANGPAASSAGGPAGGGTQRGRTVATAVAAVPVRRGSLDAIVKLSGEVRAARSMKVYPDTAGKIMAGTVAIGTRVTSGDVIAQVDPSRPGSRFEPSPVRSPTSGTVTAVFVDPGYNATTSTAVAEIASLDELDVVVSVPERYAPNVIAGTRADVRISSLGGRAFDAVARSADPVLDSSTRSKRVFFRLPGGIRGVQPGMFAEVSITLSRSASALIVPVDAIVRREGRDAVYVVREGTAVERTVSIGLFAEAGVEILSGLEEGEIAIVQGQNLIRDGSKVNVMEGR